MKFFRQAGEKSASRIVKRLLDKAVSVKIVNEITNYAATLIDAILIGSFLGPRCISAYGLASPIFVVMPALGGTIANGVNKLCSSSIGSGDAETTNKAFASSLVGGMALSVIPMLLLLLLAVPLSVLLGTVGLASDLLGPVSDYLRGMAFGVPAFVLILILIPFMQLSGHASRLTIAITGMSVMDIILDLVNIFVLDGGMFGMAMASSLSYWFAALVLALSFRGDKGMLRFRFKNWDPRLFVRVLSTGTPYIFRQGCSLVRSLAMNHIVVHLLSPISLTVYSIVGSLQKVTYTPGSGIGDGTLMVSSMMYGEEDRHGLQRVLKEGRRLSLILNGILIVAGMILAPLLATLYLTPTSDLIGPAAYGFRLSVLAIIPFSMQMVYRSYLQGIGHQSGVMGAILCNELIYPVLTSGVLAWLFAETGFFLSFPLSEILTILTVFLIMRVFSARKNTGSEGVLMLPPEFGASEEDRLICSVTGPEEVVRFSEQVREFCLQKGQDRRGAMILGLCVEEIGINILRFGMQDKKKSCEILLYLSGGKWILRFRDDCDSFDPVAYLKSFDGENPESRFGLRLALSLADESTYIRSMNINNLRIQLPAAL